MIQHRMVGRKTQPPHHMRRLCLGLYALKLDAVSSITDFDAIEHPEKIEMPPRSAEFSVCDTFQPNGFFLGGDARNFAILHVLQFGCANGARLTICARILNCCTAQNAADVIGAERRLGSRRHFLSLYLS